MLFLSATPMPAAATIIRRRVENGPEDRLWTLGDFASLPVAAVAKTLSRMAHDGVIRRLRKGVYYRPKTTRFGETKPDLSRVFTRLLDRKHVGWKPSGLAVWNALGLTTQVPAVPTFAVDRRVQLSASKGSVRFRVVPSLHALSAEERGALDALRDLRHVPDTTPAAIVHRLVDLCRERQLLFSRMLRASAHEPPRVRALLGLIGTLLGEDADELAKLRRSLNPTTTFNLGLAADFPAAVNWSIR
jgi:hypothetical protein